MDKKKVLVIEDDQKISNVVGHTLGNLGYDVCFACDAEMGAALVDQADMVFLDLKLPGQSGESLLESLRRKGNYIPVVIMSAAVPREEALQSLKKWGIVDFLEKPFSLKEIAAKAKKAADLVEEIHFVGSAKERLKGFIERQQR